MKKYALILLLLSTCVFTSMISKSAAIYTHSNDFDLLIKFMKIPIINGDFIKYELSDQKSCDYDRLTIGPSQPGPNIRNCAQGSAVYDKENNVVNLSQDTGFFKYYQEVEPAYIVDGSFAYDASETPKNFGMYINGSFYQLNKDSAQLGSSTMQSTGYVLQFNHEGNLIINEQGVSNYVNVGNYAEDILKTSRENPVRNIMVANQQRIAQIVQDTSSTIKLQARVKKNDADRIIAYIYVNNVLVNNEPIILGFDLRGFNLGGIYGNVMIGASSYGAHTSVKVTYLEKQVWDATTL